MKDTKTTETALPVVRVDAKKLALARQVDQIANGALALFHESGSFEAEFQVAQSMVDLRAALTDEMMRPIMALMNSDLGFRTDRDPVVSPLTRDNKPTTPYPVETVRECFIESKLRGFHSMGNEWNIIAGRFYAARNGLKRKCERHPGVTDLRTSFGVPKIVGERGAVVPVVATWRKDGVADRIDSEIPVRVNGGMGVDAIIGKAERKLYKRVADRLTGTYTPDGEIEDAQDVATGNEAPAPAPAPKFTPAASSAASSATVVVASEVVAEAPRTSGTGQNTNSPEQTPQSRLAELCGASGFTLAEVKAWGKASGMIPVEAHDKIVSYETFPTQHVSVFLRSVEGFVRGVNAHKAAKGVSNA